MGKIRFSQGVWVGSLGLIFSGAFAVLAATAQQVALYWTGWAAIVAGVSLAVWGVTIDGQQWWARWWPEGTGKSPIRIGSSIFVDCDLVVDENGVEVPNVYSVALCLQMSLADKTVKTLRNVRAYVRSYGEYIQIPIRGDHTDLPHGIIEIIEVGRVLYADKPGRAPATLRVGLERRQADPHLIDVIQQRGGSSLSMLVSGEKRFGFGQFAGAGGTMFEVTITAEDTPAFNLTLKTDLEALYPHQWLNRVKVRK